MKKILLILISYLWLVNGFAQSYKPFPESNAYWIESHGWLQQNGNCGFAYFSYVCPFYFGSDTIINTIAYHSLRTHRTWTITNTQIQFGCPYQYSYNTPDGIFAYIRQDTSAKKVFIYDLVNNQDTLLYDFNLTAGNSLPQTYNNPNYPNVIVTSIDSVLLTDGYHKRYKLDIGVSLDSAAIIEGIGSTFGLFAPLLGHFENGDALICFSQNNITTYPNASALCDLTIGIASAENEQPLGIYPNPVNDFIHIQNTFVSPLLITVFSSYGTVVYKGVLQGNVDHKIDLSYLPSGIYFVSAVSDKHFTSQKIVKH
jgi:hypothetical protein